MKEDVVGYLGDVRKDPGGSSAGWVRRGTVDSASSTVLPVEVDLLVLVIQAEEGDLHRDNSFLVAFDLVRQGNGYCRGRKTAWKTCIVRRTLHSVFIYIRHHILPVDGINHDALLICASDRSNAKNWRGDLLTAVADDVYDHCLPAVLPPRLQVAAIVLTQTGNVLHDALPSPRR